MEASGWRLDWTEAVHFGTKSSRDDIWVCPLAESKVAVAVAAALAGTKRTAALYQRFP